MILCYYVPEYVRTPGSTAFSVVSGIGCRAGAIGLLRLLVQFINTICEVYSLLKLMTRNLIKHVNILKFTEQDLFMWIAKIKS